VLITDDTLLPNYQGIVARGGKLVGLRLSTLAFDFEGTELLMQGGIGFGKAVEGSITLAATHPTNPYRHTYHPDHKEGYRIDRNFVLEFDTGPPGDNKSPPGSGLECINGTYRETIQGLHKQPIKFQGSFELERVSLVDHLNEGGAE